MDIAKKLAQYAAEDDFQGLSVADQIVFKEVIRKLASAHYDNLPLELSAGEIHVLFKQVRELNDWVIQLS